ncbi:MAG: CapA family protein, partial [Bacteroidales bacterium]
PKTGPHQKAHPDCIKILNYAGIHLAAMANNHIMDFDNQGIIDTLELCKANNITTSGIQSRSGHLSNHYSIDLKGKRIAILNYADNEFLDTPDGSFNCNPVDSVQCFYDIQRARQSHDFLILIIHAGNEFYELPSPRTKRLYRYLVDLGADTVISHHTHAFSGYEIYQSKPIFYGLGNLIYDWPGKINSGWNKGYVVKLQLSATIDFKIIPLKQCNEIAGVFHLSSEEEEGFKKEMNRLNNIIADDKKLEAEFLKYCERVFPMYEAYIEPNFGKYITALRKRGFFPKLMSKRKRLLLLNLTRCESHREVLLKLLKRYEYTSLNKSVNP